MLGHRLDDCRLEVGDKCEVEIDVDTAADVAMAARQVVPLEVVYLFEIVFMEAESLVSRETPERRLVGVDEIWGVNDPILLQQPCGMVVGMSRPLKAVQLDCQA